MFLAVELFFLVLFVAALFMLYKNERASAKNLFSRARAEEYWDGAERRKHLRFKKTLEVDYVLEKKPHLRINGKTVDISEGGMKLLVEEKIAEGSIMDLYIKIPTSEEMVEAEARAIWAEDADGKGLSGKRLFHCGIKFLAIKESLRHSLIDYVRSVAAEGSPEER